MVNSVWTYARFCYLECIIDNELSMLPEYKAIYRKVEQKVFMLGKLRYIIDKKKSSFLDQKQAIMPYCDYVGFVLISCNIGCKREFQILQDNALRLYLTYKLLIMLLLKTFIVNRIYRVLNKEVDFNY